MPREVHCRMGNIQGICLLFVSIIKYVALRRLSHTDLTLLSGYLVSPAGCATVTRTAVFSPLLGPFSLRQAYLGVVTGTSPISCFTRGWPFRHPLQRSAVLDRLWGYIYDAHLTSVFLPLARITGGMSGLWSRLAQQYWTLRFCWKYWRKSIFLEVSRPRGWMSRTSTSYLATTRGETSRDWP